MYANRDELVENFCTSMKLFKADAKALPSVRGNATHDGLDRIALGRRAQSYLDDMKIMVKQFAPTDFDYDWTNDAVGDCQAIADKMWFVR